MRIRYLLFAAVLVPSALRGQVRFVEGAVTYVRTGELFVSLGRAHGMREGLRGFVVAKKDTIAALTVIAVSTSSSSCTVTGARRQPREGDDAVFSIEPVERGKPAIRTSLPLDTSKDSLRTPDSSFAHSGDSLSFVRQDTLGAIDTLSFFDALSSVVSSTVTEWNVTGRAGAQFSFMRFGPDISTSQPGVVVSLRGTRTDIPLAIEIYTVVRKQFTQARGQTSEANVGRIYRASAQYSAADFLISAGRIVPSSAPSIGFLDGVIGSYKVGPARFGAGLGYEPPYTLRGVSIDRPKQILFAAISGISPLPYNANASYARTSYRGDLDREAVSVQASGGGFGSVNVYSSFDIDLRRKRGSAFVFLPSLTQGYAMLTAPVTDELSAGIGMDASRSTLPYSLSRTIPDSLIVSQLRYGMSAHVHIAFGMGVSLFSVYSPRSSESKFGREYSHNSTLQAANVAGTGATIRTTLLFQESAFSRSSGYGAAIQRRVADFADVTLRFNEYNTRIAGLGALVQNRTAGVDAFAEVAERLTLYCSGDIGWYGSSRSFNIFTELSVRF